MDFSLTKEKEVKKFFIIFYCVGAIGMLLPVSRLFFIKLIPFSLLLSYGYLAYFHCGSRNAKSILIFLFLLLAGFFIEVIGVKSGNVFGAYKYGESLGLKIYETPILIGFNWLFLVYATSSIVQELKINARLKILIASLLMLLYDIVLEQAAPKLDMWFWQNGRVPLQNYAAWLILALFFHSVIKAGRVNASNPLSIVILTGQFLFFVVLLIFLP